MKVSILSLKISGAQKELRQSSVKIIFQKSTLLKKKNITNITNLNLLEAHTELSANKCFYAFPPLRVCTKSFLLELSEHQQLLAQLDRILTQAMTMQAHFKLEWHSLLSEHALSMG